MDTSAGPESSPTAPGSAPADASSSAAPALQLYLARPRKLSEEMLALQTESSARTLTLREVIEVLGLRANTLLLILLALPFVTPIPLPGLSTPFGLAIGLLTLRMMLGQKPWLPEKLLSRPLPAGFFGRVFQAAARLIRFIEKLLRPRLCFLSDTVVLYRVHCGLMVLAAGTLLLPLPLPFTNSPPAWTIILIAAGLLERDGLFILGGYLAFALGVLYFIFLGEAAAHFVTWLKDYLLTR